VAEWLEPLRAHDVPSAPLQDVGQALADPQVRHREMVLAFPEHGTSLVGNPVKVLGNERAVHAWPPGLGEHTAAVMEEFGAVVDARLGTELAPVAPLVTDSARRPGGAA
jgi:crotonobetainyl-CoA:carnitine CoA-transferase CaiB-like acyl-CoA transferase